MNKTKLSNPVRLIAFFLTAFLLICTFGFSADGWQIGENTGGENSATKPDSPSDGNDDCQNGSITGDINEPEIYIPEYINRLTGVETDENSANKSHFAFVMNGDSPLYGIWEADLICELPIENGTRYIAFISESENLWKCGDIEPTRGYIANIARYFGGICVSYGSDDFINYNKCDMSGTSLDLSISDKYHYTEFGSSVYCNSDLLYSATSSGTLNPDSLSASLPYSFVNFGNEPITYGENHVSHIKIEKSQSTFCDVYYNNESLKYTVSNNGAAITDAINGKVPEFANCFVLFADSVTYDNIDGSQMVVDTIGSGTGYYFSMGGMCEIKWSASQDGIMSFTLNDGTNLTVNRGSSYITFQKTSTIDKVTFQ